MIPGFGYSRKKSVKMKGRKWVWKILLFLGSVPFLIALAFCFVSSLTAYGMSFGDYIVLYSFLYWPTYIIGIVLIVLSFVKIKME